MAKLNMEEKSLMEFLEERGSRLDTPTCVEHKAFMNLKRKGLVFNDRPIKKYSITYWHLTNKGKKYMKQRRK